MHGDFSPFAIMMTGLASALSQVLLGEKSLPLAGLRGKFVDTRIEEGEAGKPLRKRFQVLLI